MDNIVDILNWLIKPNNREKLSDCELNYITNSINKCIENISPIIKKIESEKKILLYIKSLKRKRK